METTCTAAAAPGAIPVLGHVPRLLRDPLGFWGTLPSYGDLVTVRVGTIRAVVVCTPELTRHVLLNDKIFDKGGLAYDVARPILGNGLGTCPHSQHRRQRRLIQPAFNPQRLPGYSRVIARRAAAVVDAWQPGQAVDVLTEMTAITTHALAETVLGTALAADVHAELTENVNLIVLQSLRRIILPDVINNFPLPANLRYNRATARVKQIAHGIITERRRAGSTDHDDMLSMLLATTDFDGGSLSDAELVDQIMTFFFAGIETTAVTLSWALRLLSDHPDIQDQLHAEVDQVLTGDPVDHLPELVLTARIINEALRLYPPTWLLTRIASTDTELGGHPIAAGTTVVFSSYLIHRRPDEHPNAQRFDPDRWNTPPGRHAYVPFGGGARKCIGEGFALAEATLVLATIARRWRLAPIPSQRGRILPGGTIRPKGLRLRAIARSSS